MAVLLILWHVVRTFLIPKSVGLSTALIIRMGGHLAFD